MAQQLIYAKALRICCISMGLWWAWVFAAVAVADSFPPFRIADGLGRDATDMSRVHDAEFLALVLVAYAVLSASYGLWVVVRVLLALAALALVLWHEHRIAYAWHPWIQLAFAVATGLLIFCAWAERGRRVAIGSARSQLV